MKLKRLELKVRPDNSPPPGASPLGWSMENHYATWRSLLPLDALDSVEQLEKE